MNLFRSEDEQASTGCNIRQGLRREGHPDLCDQTKSDSEPPFIASRRPPMRRNPLVIGSHKPAGPLAQTCGVKAGRLNHRLRVCPILAETRRTSLWSI